jgi:hypothetical protein
MCRAVNVAAATCGYALQIVTGAAQQRIKFAT